MSSRTVNQHADLVIVGEGILGRCVALLASRSLPRNKRIVVVSDRRVGVGIPNADTHRNHSWLQSGMLYGGNAVLAAQMLTSGRSLHRAIGVEPPAVQGIFRIDRQDSAKIIDTANMLGLRSQVRPIARTTAQRRLGEFFEEGYAHFSVPDAPFDEPRVMTELRAQAELEGVQWIYGRVSLQRVGSEALVAISDRDAQQVTKIQASCVVLCTGAGTIELLDSIGIQHNLAVFQSGLIRIYSDSLMEACLLADRTKHLSVVRFPVGPWNRSGCTVIGGGEKRPVSAANLRAGATRQLSRSEIDNLWNLMPEAVRTRYEHAARYTVGFKTERVKAPPSTPGGQRANRRPVSSTVDSAVGVGAGLSNLLYAVPGKATLAWHCATTDILPEIRARTRKPGITISTHRALGKSPADPQQELPFHHQDVYKDQSED